jgi:soluble cytochrome b562
MKTRLIAALVDLILDSFCLLICPDEYQAAPALPQRSAHPASTGRHLFPRRVMGISMAVLALTVCAHATSLKEFNARTKADQAAIVANFIDKMTTDLRTKNPDLAQSIRDWYAVKQPGKPLSAGMERLVIELGALDRQIADGRVDPAKVQLESVIVYVTKEKFAPPSASSK